MPGTKELRTLIRFGPFEADSQSQELKKHGVRLRLPGQSFQILKVLVEHPGELVTREELRQTLWPSDTFVDFEHSLNAAVNRLRECLGDDADNPRYIETLPRRGYRFIGAVEGTGEGRPVSSHRNLFALISTLLLVLAVVTGGLWYRSRQRAAPLPAAPSIAVLPFADLSPGHDQEYFSDGLAEEILNDLATIPNLRVAARTSAFQFKGKNEDLRAIGQKLNADNILEGSVRKEGTHVRITLQLVKADDGFHLWAQSYDRELTGALALQDEIAKAVTSALQVKLLPGNSEAFKRASRTMSPEAYQDYLQARYFASMNNKESLLKALQYVNKAIQSDSGYAAAYAWRSYIRQMQWDMVAVLDDPDAMEKAERDAEKAIELGPNLADGFRVLSWRQAWYGLNCPAAERTLSRAIELAPGDAWNLEAKGLFEMCLGHQEEAVELFHQSIARDPLLVLPYLHLALNLRNLGRYQEAHAALGNAFDLDPQGVWLHETRGEVYLAQGRPKEALAEMNQEPGWPYHQLGMVLAYHALGRDPESNAALADLIANGANCCAYQIGEAYAYRGDVDQAFTWLNRAYRQHDGGLGSFKTDLLLKSLPSDPRFQDLLRRMNLPQ